ncbi:hypothetical protein [Amycolatopsis keratiniphila]|uniref:hypothetical protein n=1 Tax=Amycolatopsis keratiniphila TaxID=129921 RepID=UPI0012F7FC73|nr:hypothetical protein [Amycolatopsis keratiniphila]
MQIIDVQQPDLAGEHAVQGAMRELGRGAALVAGMTEVLQHRPIEILHAGVAGQPDPAGRPAFVPVLGELAVLGDLAEVELFGEGQHRGQLGNVPAGSHTVPLAAPAQPARGIDMSPTSHERPNINLFVRSHPTCQAAYG